MEEKSETNKKKKAAVCLSGGIKNGEKCIGSIERLSKYFDVKVFAHVWKIDDLEDFLKNSWSGIEKHHDSPEIDVDLKDILSSLPIESLKLENFNSKKETFLKLYESHNFIKTDAKIISPLSMFYSMYQSNSLLFDHCNQTKENFDCVIRMRYDSDVKNVEKLEKEDYLTPCIYIPKGSDWNGINDQFAYGNFKSMNAYNSLFINLNHMRGTHYYPEALLRHYLKLLNIPVKRTDLIVKINGRQ